MALELSNDPSLIDVSVFGTCIVTSMQYELVRDHPAEYARLIAGLSGPSGRAWMRGGGFLELQREYITPAGRDMRSPSEILFQGAAMEYGNGGDNYPVGHERGDGYRVEDPQTGLYSMSLEEASRRVEGIVRPK